MRAILTVDMDGAAFGPDVDERTAELARILRKLAGVIAVSGDVADRWNAHDINGNRVGELRIVEDAPCKCPGECRRCGGGMLAMDCPCEQDRTPPHRLPTRPADGQKED